MDTNEIVKALRRYALEHYEEDGWDYVVEAYDDEELLEEIRGATSLEEAIAMISPTLKVIDDHRRDIQATAF